MVTKLGAQAADRGQQSATEGTLWDKAYYAMKKDQENQDRCDRIAKYEDLLSRVLLRGLCSARLPIFFLLVCCNSLFSIVGLDANARLP